MAFRVHGVKETGPSYCRHVEGEALRRAVDAAMVPMVASLGGAGVLDAHWLPDRAGEPVVWLRVRTEIQRVELQAQAWLLPQVQVLLTRLSVPYAVIARLRLEVTSVEAEDDLLNG
ncbi:hypothetical protein GCM10011519_28030 [Marmoricola endophyticus]|uniref:Uncharacterized protein n=1 Tax=Marmoricola endophyticus TaxID=2040280 RepID=A0A917F4S0_9ACTN|nr:hypothetical protein [Marmoricola endophyticus]GGF52466.1 hypothetical protein GCM10011519_28030 [Marmoricola endophyticus]